MQKYSLLLLSGGVGSRMNIDKPKQYVRLHGMPMMMYSLLAIKEIDAIDEVILNYPKKGKKRLQKLLKSSGLNKKVTYVSAGETRQESVYKMLKKVRNKQLILHETARPMVNETSFKALIATKAKNCGYMSEIPFTVAPVDPQTQEVTGSLERAKLRNVMLPQKFVTKSLRKAHNRALKKSLTYTEDAGMIVDAGKKFYFIEGDMKNIKVTYQSDIRIAESLLDVEKEHARKSKKR